MRTAASTILTLTILYVGFSDSASAEDPCVEVLHAQVVDEFKVAKTANFTEDIREAVCKSTTSWKNKNVNAGIGIQIKKIPMGAKFSQGQMESLSEDICTDKNRAVSQQDALDIASRLGAAKVNDTYLRCREIDANRLGLKSNSSASADGKIITIKLSWNDPTPEGSKGPFIMNPWADIAGPLECNPLAKDLTIIPGGRTFTCLRKNLAESASIVVHTSWSDLSFVFDGHGAAKAPAKCGAVLIATDDPACFQDTVTQIKNEFEVCKTLATNSTVPGGNAQVSAMNRANLLRTCQQRQQLAQDALAARGALDVWKESCDKQGKGSAACQGYQDTVNRLNTTLGDLFSSK